jgi:hypothetical protein
LEDGGSGRGGGATSRLDAAAVGRPYSTPPLVCIVGNGGIGGVVDGGIAVLDKDRAVEAEPGVLPDLRLSSVIDGDW